MLTLIVFLLSITFVLTSSVNNISQILKYERSKICPWGIESSVFGDNQCYIFHEFPLNYYNSETFCEGYGATLAIVGNGDVNQFISETTKTTFDPDGEKSYWLGAQNLVAQNQWKWVDGSLMNGFTNWISGEHSNNRTEERCLSAKVGSGKWFAAICYTEKPAVCVYRKVSDNPKPTSFPSTLPLPSSPPIIPSPTTTSTSIKTTTTPNPCTKGWEYFIRTNSCYFLKEATNFYYDEAFCEQQSGHLSSIHDYKENEFIIEIAQTKSADKNSPILILIGLHQFKEDPNSWNWSDTSPIDYSIWDSTTSPTNTTRCACINADQSDTNGFRHWKYAVCDDKKIQYSVCKRLLP